MYENKITLISSFPTTSQAAGWGPEPELPRVAIGELRPRRHPSLAPLLAGRLLRAAWRIHRLAAPCTAAARYRTHCPRPADLLKWRCK